MVSNAIELGIMLMICAVVVACLYSKIVLMWHDAMIEQNEKGRSDMERLRGLQIIKKNLDMREIFYGKLDLDRIKVSRNTNPIEMKLFISFLTVDVVKVEKHSGSCTGWTKYENEDIKLSIGGGIVDGIEYLDHLTYKKDLHNQYNNYVTALNIFDILNEKGRDFFLKYYQIDIDNIFDAIEDEIETAKYKMQKAQERKGKILNELKVLKSGIRI